MTKIFNFRAAMDVLMDAGCDPQYCSNAREWYNPVEHTLRFPQNIVTYKYATPGVFWYQKKYVGLSEQLFPHVSLDSDFLANLMAGADPSALLDSKGNSRIAGHDEINAAKISDSMQEIRNMIATSFLVERTKLQDRKLVPYNTNNEFVHRYAESCLINSQVEKYYPHHARETYIEAHKEYLAWNKGADWREYLSDDLRKRLGELELYGEIVTKTQNACMKIFHGLWQLEGDVDNLPIPEKIQIVQKYYRDNHTNKFPNLTRGFTMYDPEVGLFGNMLLKMLKMFSCVKKIIHPIICILGIGLFSCYHLARELGFNILGYGWHATGKSKTAIDTFEKLTAIPGTIVKYTTQTAAADTTHKHVYDTIILSDEVEQWKVDPVEAKKHQGLVNKAKVKMTDNQVGHNVYKDVVLEDGTRYRWSELVTTDHYCTVVEVTNSEVNAEDALASRYHRFMMPLPKIPVRELGTKVNEHLQNQTKTYMHINQYLMCCAMKCATVGAMLPEPDREMWQHFSSRVIDYLELVNAIKPDEKIRNLDIMWPLVRQFIYTWAIHCAFDMPGSPNYKKKFELNMIREIQPYLYCTMEHLWFGWTALATSWVDDNNSKFIAAVERLTHFDKIRREMRKVSESCTNYNVFERDIKNEVKFRHGHAEEVEEGDKAKGNHRTIDLNYVSLSGTKEQIANRIAAASDGLSKTDVLGIMNFLSTHSISIPGGAYYPQKAHDFKKWHKATSLIPFNKDTDVNGNLMPMVFREENPDTTQFRTEFDVPRNVDANSLLVVDMSDMQNNKGTMHIMVNCAETFRTGIVVDALVYATLTPAFPEGKMITGIPNENNTMQLHHREFSRRTIDILVREADKCSGWERNEFTGEVEWAGDPNTPEKMRPVSRTRGVTINIRAAISPTDAKMFSSCPIAPVAVGNDSWKEKIQASLETMKETQKIVYDFDFENALHQHLRCGRKVDEPLMTPKYIKERYIQSCTEMGIDWHADVDYPHDFNADTMEREVVYDAAKASDAGQQWIETDFRMTTGTSSVPTRTNQRLANNNNQQRDRVSKKRDRPTAEEEEEEQEQQAGPQWR